jgi:mono/diheme cytochrome c family protein
LACFAAVAPAADKAAPPPAADVAAARPSAADLEFFEKRVRPVLANNCFECHGPGKQKSSLRLDSAVGFLRGGDGGAIFDAKQPEKSRILAAIGHAGELKMPPGKKLAVDDIEAITDWVKRGAPWPAQPVDIAADAWKKHWAFQPLTDPKPPPVRDEKWAQAPLDRFVLNRLEANGMKPAFVADRRTLIRRAYFDLLGLPPKPEEVDAFVSDRDSKAFEKLIDRLLASPQYGERWGRHWLDVARYANERGYIGVNVDRTYPFAYTYRDWVIRAFNEDLPYDRFLMLQLAADQMQSGPDTRALAAMGFLTVGRRFINNQHDIIDDRIDVVLRGMQGLTVTCARCHDHKYDPIPTKDYYSLYGVFASSREPDELPLLEPFQRTSETEAFEKELGKLEEAKRTFVKENEQMRKERPREYREKIKPFENKIQQLEAKHPGAPPRGMVMVDAASPMQPHVFLRGNPATQGDRVPRQFLGFLAGDSRKPFAKGSGRLELAQAIASKDNPLTARVLVNRVWMHHFGHGLVRTPSDFGLRSEPPSHPELLDYLAARFMQGGWSIKKLHRLIMLSSTYQMSSTGDAKLVERDPDNVLLSHQNRRRMDFEALRDSLLAVSGQLDPTLGGQAVDLSAQPFSRRRTVYGFIDRQNLPGMYRVFDFASPDTHSPQRFTTTVPQQALYLMNNPFVIEQARKLIARAEVQEPKRDEERINVLYRLLFGRAATAGEVALGKRFLALRSEEKPEAKPATPLSPWERYAQVLLVSNAFVFVD